MKWSNLATNSIFTVYSNGDVCIPFGSINKNGREEEIRDYLKERIEEELGFSIPENYKRKYPIYKASEWEPKISVFFSVIEGLLQKYPLENSA